MKSLCNAALPLLLCCAGCFPSVLGLNEPKPPPPAPPAVKVASEPVTPESANAANARERCDALANEIDRAERAR